MAISIDIEKIVFPVLDRYECDLVLSTFRPERSGLVLRLFIERRGSDPDKGSGVDLKLCSLISRDLSTVLDVEDAVDKPYILEVSSPGIERPLVRKEDFERFAGRQIKLKTVRTVEGRRKFKGLLKGCSNGSAILSNGDGKTVEIPLKIIEKANLVYEPNGLRPRVGDQ
jgi:ribosome maturation factor RimP